MTAEKMTMLQVREWFRKRMSDQSEIHSRSPRSTMMSVEEKIKNALPLIRELVHSTDCPDPDYGGCIGGLIPGYGCLHEAAVGVRKLLERGEVEKAIELLKVISSKETEGRIEVAAALNVLR